MSAVVHSQYTRKQRRTLTLLLAALPSLGPFSIDAYLPSMHEIATQFGTTEVLTQQTLTAFMLPFALMALWHGAISDALGRRSVTLAMLAGFLVASVGCALSWSIGSLIFFRALQGMTAGAGMVIGRAIVRDVLEGPAAQRMFAMVTMTFAIAPAIAPVIGGWLHVWFSWRAVFVFVAVLAAAIWVWVWRALPETLQPADRRAFRPADLWHGYLQVLCSPTFLALGVAVSAAFSGMFVYVVSAPEFLVRQLGVSDTGFLWLFGPITAGLFLGMILSNRLAGRWSPTRTIWCAVAIMAAATTINLTYHLLRPPALPWSILPLFVYITGSALSMPSLTLLALDLFPQRRGMAASCQSFMQAMANALVTGIIAPLLWGSTVTLALGQATAVVIAVLAFGLFAALASRRRPAAA